MNAFTFRAGRRDRAALHHPGDHDRFLSCDTQPPNRHAQRRGFFALLFLCAAAASVALIAGTLQGFGDMGAAFPNLSALLDAASWDKFFAGLGRVAALVAVVAVALMLLRRRHRKAKKAAH